MASLREFEYTPVATERQSSSAEFNDDESATTVPLKDDGMDDYFELETRSRSNVLWVNILLAIVSVCSIVLVLCWTLHTFLGHDLHISPTSKPPPRLDNAYTPEVDFEIVMSMYKEDPTTINETLTKILSFPPISPNNRLWIYTKDEDANTTLLQTHFPTAKILQLPNIGREGHTHPHELGLPRPPHTLRPGGHRLPRRSLAPHRELPRPRDRHAGFDSRSAVAQPDSMNSPALGFSLERLWGGIMQCADLGVAARCPTMLSGWRRKGGKGEDCQCFDREPGADFIGFL